MIKSTRVKSSYNLMWGWRLEMAMVLVGQGTPLNFEKYIEEDETNI